MCCISGIEDFQKSSKSNASIPIISMDPKHYTVIEPAYSTSKLLLLDKLSIAIGTFEITRVGSKLEDSSNGAQSLIDVLVSLLYHTSSWDIVLSVAKTTDLKVFSESVLSVQSEHHFGCHGKLKCWLRILLGKRLLSECISELFMFDESLDILSTCEWEIMKSQCIRIEALTYDFSTLYQRSCLPRKLMKRYSTTGSDTPRNIFVVKKTIKKRVRQIEPPVLPCHQVLHSLSLDSFENRMLNLASGILSEGATDKSLSCNEILIEQEEELIAKNNLVSSPDWRSLINSKKNHAIYLDIGSDASLPHDKPILESVICTKDQPEFDRTSTYADDIILVKEVRPEKESVVYLQGTGSHITLRIKECHSAEVDFELQIAKQLGICDSCGTPILSGGLFSHARSRFCHYTGRMNCLNCHRNESKIIPSRFLQYGDTHDYTVCRQAYTFLDTLEHLPIIELSWVSPRIVSNFQALIMLRRELVKARDYVYSCPSCNEILQAMGWRNYLLHDNELFAFRDMICTFQDKFLPLILLRDSLIEHITESCTVCKAKGFICEYCSHDVPIFPFNLDMTIQCPGCKSYFHKLCYSPSSCPRCKRLRKRNISQLKRDSKVQPL